MMRLEWKFLTTRKNLTFEHKHITRITCTLMVKHSAGNIMLWGRASLVYPGKFLRVKGMIYGSKCKCVLQENMFCSSKNELTGVQPK